MSAVSTSRYAFLAQPPQKQQKKRPVQLQPVHPVNIVTPSPSSPPIVAIVGGPRRRASITTWALSVQPGSPAPRTPPSARRRGSFSSSRKPRVAHHRVSPTSSSFLHLIDTPTTASGPKSTPSVKDLTFDLTNLGYTSVFVKIPGTPSTPSAFISSVMNSNDNHVPLTPAATGSKSRSKLTLKRFRSLGVLRRGRARSTSSNSPPSPTKKTASKPPSPTRPRAKAPKAKATLPPTLDNELLLLQFMDGGSLERNMKRVMAKEAKRAAKNASAAAERPVGDAHRDGNGGLWRDRDEEMEYVPLLAPATEDEGWVQFDADAEEIKEGSTLPIPTISVSSSPSSSKRTRRRPAPLDLAAAQPASSPASPGFGDSFAPSPLPIPASAPIQDQTVKKQMSRLNVMGLFGRA
ncbi:hypothetical protein C8J56DRAFT_1020054 [Mycena floridula]|nr:hypothetical protein C8J56DRAFT_1020054 [Mycena floridula]